MTLTTLKRKKMLTRMETIEGIAKKYTLFPCSKVFSLGLLKDMATWSIQQNLFSYANLNIQYRFFNKPLTPCSESK